VIDEDGCMTTDPRRPSGPRRSSPEFALRELLGFQVDSEHGVGRAWLDIDERHINPHGTLHGAVPFTLVDTAMGAATMSVLADDRWCTTVDIHTRYLAACRGGRITATATVKRAGRRIVHLDAVVSGEDGTEYVLASGVFAVISAG
jgi:acyl-CoA thioesterase